ncbi:GntR family transcriptional regulator [Roseobacter sinensis]|uniref:GntR family transcriptional regulator n=1 Tax=Roseobacter sinensis TaxID=2931391 RepID=A0ABT3BB18_9RHOB|nr:GntR family transcriptional regulator [Roseobacter sp. WL0113]MCV3270778.1 GntR family transcriptional regulator [Roseobacter sp. WL0113]
MTKPALRDWQSVRDEVRRRIHARQWKPGDLIPNETDLAAEFGCARATVNRALRTLAETGLLDRRRKAGTRVALQPVAKATLDIPVIRHEVEGRGQTYGYQRLARDWAVPPAQVSGSMRTPASRQMLHLCALHLADDLPYAVEQRWINTATVPAAEREPFLQISANEWLLAHAPYTHGDIAFSAAAADEAEAALLSCAVGAALFVVDRLTWDNAASVTKVRLIFPPGHQLRTAL